MGISLSCILKIFNLAVHLCMAMPKDFASAPTVGVRQVVNRCNSLSYYYYLLPTHACIKWCHNMTTKGNQHIKNRKNSVRKWVADGTLTVLQVRGKTNIADIYTKEMRNSANFRRLCDSCMCHSSNYKKHFLSSHKFPSPVAAQTAHYIALPCPGLLEVIALHILFCIPEAI
jgi:hypothetical protein